MKIGITGHNGMVGKSVSDYLSNCKYTIVKLDKITRNWKSQNKYSRECSDDLSWILHLGAKTSIQESWDNPILTHSNNFESTLIALKIAKISKASFLYISSYVYGYPEYLPIDEKHPVKSVNPYMGSKIIGEILCQQFCEHFNIPLIILRPFYIYGKAYKPGRLISDLINAIKSGNEIVINDPHAKRDYLYIDDFNTLIYKIISHNSIKTGVYNVGFGISYTNLEVAKIASELSNDKSQIIIKSSLRPNDIQDCSVDVSVVKKTFSWNPTFSLLNGLKQIIK